MNKFGIVRNGGHSYSYQIGAISFDQGEGSSAARIALVRTDGYNVYPYGVNNLEPNEAKEMISANRLLPELIEKQIRMLYGRGPVLYKNIISEDGEFKRQYLQDSEIEQCLDSWQSNGLADDYKTYLNKCIRSFYYSEGIFTKWRLSAGSLIRKGYPVTGLEHVSELRARLATTRDIFNRTDFEDSEFDKVLVGSWDGGKSRDYKAYARFDYGNPLAYASAISYSKNPSHGEEIYSYNVFFRGIKDWVKGSNLTPRYINSFLEGSMSARQHIVIPDSWVKSKENMLMEICERNAELKAAGKELQKIYFSETDVMEVGSEYNAGLLSDFITREIKKFTSFLSGAGKNQGKVYVTFSHTNQKGEEERWKIEEVPQKYKEFIEALTSYDKRADEVITSAKGIDSSISNISKDGVISKSGSDVFYNYMIYMLSLPIPEEVVCKNLNLYLKINFQKKYSEGIRIGFYRPALALQQDTNPDQRLANQKQ